MRLYRLGDLGEPVRDIQDRLSALGYDCSADPRGDFGSPTHTAVLAFQRDRGLNPDGLVGPETWRRLYEAGYRLGDRILYLRRPMLRGEDVAELQSRLNNLGFDAGKVDGVFGPKTGEAVLDFQHNRGLPEDGKAGPEVITEMQLVTRGPMRAGREAIREREWLRSLPAHVVGTRVFFDPACRNLREAAAAWAAAGAASLELQERGGLPLTSRAADTSLPERVRAGRANRMGAELVVSFQLAEVGEDAVYYFGSERSRSEAGALLAERVAAIVGGRVEARATSILRETRAPAVIVAHHRLDEEVGRKTVEGLEAFFLTAGGGPPQLIRRR
jgi:N-acetylmuramoyl-L-alanine amidase